MNIYLKNFGLYLGGAPVATYLFSFFTYTVFFLGFVAVIAGTILGVVMTHKAEGKRINFGKAAGVVALVIVAFSFLSFLTAVSKNGTEYISWFLADLLVYLLINMVLAFSILLATGTWYMYEKAGEPGWASLIPIYNLIVMCRIGGKPGWWVVMMLLVPIANIVFFIMLLNAIAKNFGKGPGFTVGLVFLQQIFFAILGYGDASYTNSAADVSTGQDNAIIDN